MEYRIVYDEESGLDYKELFVKDNFMLALIIARENADIGDTFKIYQEGVDGFIHCETVI